MPNEIIYDRRYDGNHDESAERAFDLEERRYVRERCDDDAIEGRNAHVAAPIAGVLNGFFDAPRRTMPGYAQIANGIYVRKYDSPYFRTGRKHKGGK
jgi:hypothetical protein